MWEWIFGRAVKAISSMGVRSPWWELLAKKSILCTIVFKRSILIYLTVILSGLRNCLFSDAQLFFLSGFFLYFLVSYLVHKFLYGVIIINYDTIIFYIRYIRYLILSKYSCVFLSVPVCFHLFPSVSVCFCLFLSYMRSEFLQVSISHMRFEFLYHYITSHQNAVG